MYQRGMENRFEAELRLDAKRSSVLLMKEEDYGKRDKEREFDRERRTQRDEYEE